MAISTEKKQEIFEQIRAFNNTEYGRKTTIAEQYYFVEDDVAEDCSNFVKFLVEQKKVNFSKSNIADMAFGSGNLTSHIVLDNINDFSKITFNDKNKEANTKLFEKFDTGKAELTQFDFLNKSEWNYKSTFDIAILNPLIGGGLENHKVDFKDKDPIISNKTIKDYLGLDKSFAVKQIDDESKILITAEGKKVGEAKESLKNIEIFNYYDVFAKTDKSKEWGSHTDNVKFRQTLNKILKPEGTIIFFGEEKYFNSLFADFNTVFEYSQEGSKKIFIATKKGSEKIIIKYKKENGKFIIDDGKTDNVEQEDINITDIESSIGETLDKISDIKISETSAGSVKSENNKQSNEKEEPFIIDVTPKGKLDFKHKNILLKGVPGTGKSRLIDKKLLVKLELNNIIKETDPNNFLYDNILRINVHSASSNADLMQGIGLTTNTENQIEYKEKQGLILNKLEQAIKHPNQAFAIILEEIQENSLNELIGDLIYLIEEDKRVDISKYFTENKVYPSFEAFVNELTEKQKDIHFVEIPYLVSNKVKEHRKLIVPNNLYFFCTSNYRDDKKIIEDNLLRRFTLIELYPKESVIEKAEVQTFLKQLNNAILKEFKDKEIHPDRFLIGHAYWINVDNEIKFYQALLKTITEFKDIREIEFGDIEPVLKDLKLPFGTDKDLLTSANNYKEIIDKLQKEAFKDIL